MKGHVYQRGSTWYYKFRLSEKDEDGRYPWVSKGGHKSEKDAWSACRKAIAAVEQGKHV